MKTDIHNESIFSDSKDMMRMQRLKSAYVQSFPAGQSSFADIPDLLNIEEKSESYLFFSKRKVFCVNKGLEADKIQIDYFRKASGNLNKSPIRDHSLAVISTGINYIKEREEDYTRRLDGFSLFSEPYDNIQDPRYYVIQIISERLKILCDWKISEELANEYGFLSDFIGKVLEIASEIFKTSNKTGFHYFLYEAQNEVNLMKKMALIYYERSSIPAHLSTLIRLLDSYKSELAALLVHVLSSSKHNGTFHAYYLKDKNDARINDIFLKSDTYKSVRSAYLNHSLNFLTLNSYGIKEFSKKFSTDSLEESLKHYNNLLYLLFNTTRLSKNIELLIKSSNLEGDWETARDEALNSVLDANLSIASEFLKETDKSATIIYQTGINANKESKCVAGFPMNLQYSGKILSEMQRIQNDIEKSRSQIKKRIEKIKILEPNTRKNIKSEIIIKTNDLINKFKDKLKGIPASIIKNVKNFMPKDKKTNEIWSKNICSIKQKKYQNISTLIDYDTAKQETFDILIEQIDTELDFVIPEFIEKLETIKQLTLELDETIKSPESFYEKAEYLFYGIKKYSKELKYQSYDFSLFSINQISLSALFDLFKKKQLLIIKQLLTPLGVQNDPKVENILQEIKIDIARKLEKLTYRLISIKSFFPKIMVNSQSGLAHYKKKIFKSVSTQKLNQEKKKDITELFVIAIELKNCKEPNQFKNKFDQFYQKVRSINYIVNYYGGEKLNSKSLNRKFPDHIKKILDFYEGNIQISHSLQHYQWMLQEISKIASDAIENKSIQIRFFAARDLSTEHVYQAILASTFKSGNSLLLDFQANYQVQSAAM